MKKLILIILLLSCNKIIRKINFKNKDINKELVLSIINNDTKKAIELIKEGADVNYKNNGEYTSLMYASGEGNTEVVKLLMDKGANVNDKNNYGKTALMDASEKGHTEVVKLLIDRGATINDKINGGWTSLTYASYNGHIEVVKLLIDKGANVNDKNNYGKTSLMLAAQNGHIEVVKLLIDEGANVNDKNNYGKTSLMLAYGNGHTETVKLLIDEGANVNDKTDYDNTSLMLASNNGHTEVVKLLIEKGANVNSKNNNGWTSLMLASNNGNTETVKLLIDKGANIDNKYHNVSYYDSFTVLMLASYNGCTEVVKLLIDRGANVNDKTDYDNTSLMIASNNGHTEVVKLLIEKGANVNSKNNNGWTSLMYASRGHLGVVKFLLEKRAIINEKDNKGKTALMHASKSGNLEIVKILLNAGADIDATDSSRWFTKGKSSLEFAYKKGHKQIIEFLISNGADISTIKEVDLENILIKNVKNKEIYNCLLMIEKYKNKINYNYRDKEGNNFLHYAAITNNQKLFAKFLEKECNLNSKNNKEETPLYKALCVENINEDFIIYLIDKGAILYPKSYINGKTLIDVISSYERICNKLVYEPLINKLLDNKININQNLNNKIKEIIKKLKLKDEDLNNKLQIISFIKNALVNLPLEINLNQIIIKEDDNKDVELNIEVFDEIFQHFKDEDYWDSIINKAVQYVKDSYIRDLDKILLDYLECVTKKGLSFAKSNFNLSDDKKFKINKLIKEKINYIKNIFKNRLEGLKNTKPVNKPLFEMNKQEREQNTDFQRKKQLAKLLKLISLMAIKGNNYEKIKFSINQILDAMVCREGSLEALEEAIRYISEIKEADQSIKEILNEELMKLRYELFKEVVNEEINNRRIKLNIIIDGHKSQLVAEMVPELLPSLLKEMHNELKISLKYLDSDDNYNHVYNKKYIVDEIKRRYKDRIVNYIKDIIEEEGKSEKEKSRVLWNRARDYIERNIFEGKPILQIEDFIYDEDYKIKREAVKALLINLNLY